MSSFDKLVFDISYRIPRKNIVFRFGEGYFVDNIKLSENFVERLVNEGFVTLNRYGGMKVTETAQEHAINFMKSLGTIKVESHRQKGQMLDRVIVPEEFNGEE